MPGRSSPPRRIASLTKQSGEIEPNTMRWTTKVGCLLAAAVLVGGLVWAIRVLPLWTWGLVVPLAVGWALWSERRAPRVGRRLAALATPWSAEHRLALCMTRHHLPHGGRQEFDLQLRVDGGRAQYRRRDRHHEVTEEREVHLSGEEAAAALAHLRAHDLWALPTVPSKARDGLVVVLAMTDGNRRHAFSVHMPAGAYAAAIAAVEAVTRPDERIDRRLTDQTPDGADA